MILHNIVRNGFSRNIDLMSLKSRNRDQKIEKKTECRFSKFRLWPLYSTGVKVGSQRPWHVLKHTELQSET